MLKNAPTDPELWEAIKQSDARAFELLFERYWQSIYTTAFSYVRDQEVCTTIVDDIFLNVWVKRGSLNILSLKNYLTAAARYHVYRHMKTVKSSKLSYVDDYDGLLVLNKIENKGEENIRDLELENNLEGLLNKLPKRCCEIFMMSRIENLTNAEIADKLSISKRTVENQITAALKHLRENLKYIAFLIFYLIQ